MAASSDEGEIIDNGHGDLKATSLPRNAAEENGVDRRDRNHSRHSSPDADSASRYSGHSRRSRSPPSRGLKRSRVNYDHPRGKGRDYQSKYNRGRYDDLDRPPSRGSYHDYDARERDRDYRDRGYENRDRYSDKRQRKRSPSPYRSRHSDKSRAGRFVPERRYSRDASTGPRYDEQNPNTRPNGHASTKTGPDVDPATSRAPKEPARSGQGASVTVRDASNELSVTSHTSFIWIPLLTFDRQPGKEPAPEPEIDFEEPEVIDEDAEIERRRKRREEIMAKSSSATPLLLHAVGATDKTRAPSPPSLTQGYSQLTEGDSAATPRTPGTPRLREFQKPHMPGTRTNSPETVSPRSPGTNDASSDGQSEFATEKRIMNTHANRQIDDEDGPSAADYDPTIDMKEDERRDELRHGQIVLHGESHVIETVEQKLAGSTQPSKTTKDAADSNEDDDDFDMFAEDFDEEKFAVQQTAGAAPAAETAEADQASGKGGILEGDDKDGYYKIRIGEVMCGRYQVQATLGKGMFSGVVRAVDMTTKQIVAIKMMRNNDALRKGGYTEIAILEKLNKADPENRKHIVKFERSFDYKGHLCMAFENLSLNLREVLRKFGNNVGINLAATKTYAYQIFVALAHMQRCDIIHADLKPDNILVRHPQSSEVSMQSQERELTGEIGQREPQHSQDLRLGHRHRPLGCRYCPNHYHAVSRQSFLPSSRSHSRHAVRLQCGHVVHWLHAV